MKLAKLALSIFIACAAFVIGVSAHGVVSWLNEDPPDFDKCHSGIATPEPETPPLAVEEKAAPQSVVTESDEDSMCSLFATGDYAAIRPFNKKFEGFEGVTIIADEWNEKRQEYIKVKPKAVILWRKQEVDLASVTINGDSVSFVSKSRKGVSFRFHGKLVTEFIRIKDDEIGEYYNQQVDLKGILTRFDGGKKTADGPISFTAYCAC